MALTLYVDGDAWRSHLRAVQADHPGLTPVVKGNGYGFGLGRLARRSQWLGVDTIAVGTYAELPHVASRFDGSLLVLTPWRPFDDVLESETTDAARVIHTVGRLEDLRALVAHGRRTGHRPRVVLERLTSMLRHGFGREDLREAAALVRADPGVVVEGTAVHLPLARTSHVAEVERVLAEVVEAGIDSLDHPGARTVWISHLSESELAQLQDRHPGLTLRPRIGTTLWLGDRSALAVRATVLDTHAVGRGDTYGYRGRTAPRAGTILVVSGGTAHGIGLEAPTGEASLRARAASLARGGLDAAGLVRSPYTVGGKQRLFAEPPHMQASMLFLPSGAAVPAVGDEVGCRVRFTTTDVDRVEIS